MIVTIAPYLPLQVAITGPAGEQALIMPPAVVITGS